MNVLCIYIGKLHDIYTAKQQHLLTAGPPSSDPTPIPDMHVQYKSSDVAELIAQTFAEMM